MWVKICGITNLEDALHAAACGADALGFVFAPSPRRVTPALAAEILAALPGTVETYGLFVDAGFEEVAAIVARCGLGGVQLHAGCAPGLPRQLRQRFGAELRIVRALHFDSNDAGPGGALFEERVRACAREGAGAVLVDARVEGMAGGTGTSFDWKAASAAFARVGREIPLIAAGGLRPENVAGAIGALRPWGVDTSSGVEAAPGKKDVAKVRGFIGNAKSAAARLDGGTASAT